MLRDDDGETRSVDLAELRAVHDEWRDVISAIFDIEAVATTTRAEFGRLPAKYVAIARAIGADRASRERDFLESLVRAFVG